MCECGTHRKQQAHDTQAEETSTHLRNSAIVDLLTISKAAEEESHAQNEKKIRQDRAK